MEPARQLPPPHPPDHPDRLPDDALAHLARADVTIDEDDRHLAHPEPRVPGAEHRLDLERVAVGADGVDVQPLEHPAVIAFEAARQIVERKPRHDPRVPVGGPGKEQPPHRPVNDRHSAHVARSDDDVEILGKLEELRQMPWIVGEIGVHLEGQVVAVIDRPMEPGNVRGPEAQLAGPMDDVDPRVRGRQLVGERAGPVRGAVVDDEHLEPRVLRQDLRDDGGQIVALVVGRDDDQCALSHRPSARAGPGSPPPGAPR